MRLLIAYFLMLGCVAFGTASDLNLTSYQEGKFSDEEYEKFVSINVEVIPIQQEAQSEMLEAITEEGLNVQRFQELAQAQQQGKIKEVSNGAEELAKYNNAGQEVRKLQQEVQINMQKVITENDMTSEKFQEISIAYQQNPKVKSKVDELIAEEMGD